MKVDFNQYYQRIDHNRTVIESLDGDQYPNMKNLLERRGALIKKRLLFIFQEAQRENQEGGHWGYWFFMPLSRFAREGAEYGRQKTTWEKTIILLSCLGMIERELPTDENASTPYRQAALQYAKENGHDRATAFISIPEYTSRQLDYIERKAARWVEAGANFNHFSKSTVIDVFGHVVADRVFQDERKKPRQAIENEKRLEDMLALILETEKYTTRDRLIQATAWENVEQRNIVKATWERASKRILYNAGAVHHRPTNKEKEILGLSDNGWIITKGVDTNRNSNL